MSTGRVRDRSRTRSGAGTAFLAVVFVAAGLAGVTHGHFAAPGRSAAAPRSPSWHLDSIPNIGYDARLSAVVALSSTNAWAVGRGSDHWNGHQWTAVPVPPPSSGYFNLNGLAVIPGSGGQMWAVGSMSTTSGSRFWILRWTGTHWKKYGAPNPGQFNTLSSVTALSPGDAWAVGSSESSSNVAVLLHWTGVAWTQVNLVPVGLSSYLAGISATSGSDIWAVGGYEPSNGGQQPLVQHWNGHMWSEVTTPPVSGNAGFQAVTVGPSGLPLAVGYTANGNSQTLIEQWDGGQWNVLPSANPGDDDQLTGVAEDGQGNAWAVGTDHRPASNQYRNLVEQWTGGAWQLDAVSNRAEANQGLAAITNVPGSGQFWAVGASVQRWTGGSWQATPAPNGGIANELRGVTLTGFGAGTRVWAVGSASPDHGQDIPTVFTRTASEPWTRSIVVPPQGGGQFYGIAAISASDIWAVGQHSTGSGEAPLADRWNGHDWMEMSPPPVSGEDNSGLDAVCGTSPGNVWAAGEQQDPSTAQPVFDHFTGGRWKRSQGPALPGYSFAINGLACAANGEVWAAGLKYGSSQAAVVMLWNGSKWALQTVPQPSGSCTLFGISLQSVSNIWAVGECFTATKDMALTEHWNGVAWKQIKSPQPDISTFLFGVTVTGRNEAWAVGEFSSQRDPSLVERWNGQSWVRDRSGSFGGISVYLKGVAISPSGNGWAVGSQYVGGEYRTLAIERR